MSVSHNVDLPIPLRPTIATDSTPIENDTSSRTCDAPYPAHNSRTSSKACQTWVPAIPR